MSDNCAPPARPQPPGVCCPFPESCHSEQGCPNPRHPQYHVNHPYERTGRDIAKRTAKSRPR